MRENSNSKSNSKRGLSVGIVGLPNVGKSTLFNALTNISVPAENYPFCTIEPNVGIIEVPDERLEKIAKIVNPKEIIPAVIKFVDIAGLVRGASQGEGLGNQFLANIRDVDAIVQVVRFFENEKITHVNNKVDPKDDIEVIESELMLKDLETVEKRLGSIEKQLKSAKKEDPVHIEYKALSRIYESLQASIPARELEYTDDEMHQIQGLGLLSLKPLLYLFNINDLSEPLMQLKDNAGLSSKDSAIAMDVKLEAELASMGDEDRALFKQEYGLEESGLERLAKECYRLLGLHSFFTAGEKEVRAWTINAGELAPQAAGSIHTDFMDKFICAEVVSFEDFLDAPGWVEARKKGKVKLQGKDYEVEDGDVMIFRHGA